MSRQVKYSKYNIVFAVAVAVDVIVSAVFAWALPGFRVVSGSYVYEASEYCVYK